MHVDDLRRGIIPGMIAGYLFLAYASQYTYGLPIPFWLHVIVSMLIGALYTGSFIQFVHLGSTIVNVLIGGMIYGLVWWIVGWNIILPLLNGTSILQLSIGPSFFGHIIFGQSLAFLVRLRDAAMSLGWGYFSYDDAANLPRRSHPAGYVYNAYDAATGLSKIGRTKDPQQRLRQLRQKHGQQIRYSGLRESNNAPKDESLLHRRLSERKVDKDNEQEWFDLN